MITGYRRHVCGTFNIRKENDDLLQVVCRDKLRFGFYTVKPQPSLKLFKKV
jgi:hypothetical protein